MAIETEIKVRLIDLKSFLVRLAAMQSPLISPRHFEDNYLFDFPDRSLSALRFVVRVRLACGKAWMTYKGPPRFEGVFKIREELETALEDGAVALKIFEKIGLQVWFRYQKYRQEHLLTPEIEGDKIHLSIDETPVGTYAEFEGSESGIREAAAAMGFQEAEFLRVSYHSLYVQYCRERGQSPGHMLFADGANTSNRPA